MQLRRPCSGRQHLLLQAPLPELRLVAGSLYHMSSASRCRSRSAAGTCSFRRTIIQTSGASAGVLVTILVGMMHCDMTCLHFVAIACIAATESSRLRCCV
jgi:hypothetical protein